MQATISGYDLFETFSTVISNGMDAFLQWGDGKTTVEQDFPEVDGKDKDLPGIKVEAREFVITFTLMADDLADFKTKYWGLRTVLFSPGLKELYYADHDDTYYIYFKKQQNVKLPAKGLDKLNPGIVFDVVFGETDPNANIDDVYIITEDDEYLIA